MKLLYVFSYDTLFIRRYENDIQISGRELKTDDLIKIKNIIDHYDNMIKQCEMNKKFYNGKYYEFNNEDDVVSVIRCKDCKWYKLSEDTTFLFHVCRKFSGVKNEYDFCSRGERRKET